MRSPSPDVIPKGRSATADQLAGSVSVWSPKAADRMRAIPVVAAVALGSGLFFRGFNDIAGQAVFTLLMAALLGAALWGDAPSERGWRATLPVLAPALAAFGWLVLGSIAGTPAAPDLVSAGLLSWLGGLAGLLAGWWAARHPPLLARVIDLWLGLSVAHLALGLVLVRTGATDAFAFWPVARGGRFLGLIGNANVTAGIAGVTALLAAARVRQAIAAPRRGRRDTLVVAIWSMAVAIALLALLATASRFTLAVALLLLAALVAPARRRIDWRLAAAGVALTALAALPFAPLIRSRFGLLGDGIDTRWLMWRRYAGMIGDAPWFGHGANGFPAAAAHSLTEVTAARFTWMVNSAHDLPLQLILSGGLPYAALLAAAAGIAAWRVLRFVWRRPVAAQDAGMLCACALLLALSMIDIVLDVPTTIGVALFLAGALWSRAIAPPLQQDGAIG